MGKRVCIFVDGENFRHSIVGLFEHFDRAEYLPKQANWEFFFDWLVLELGQAGAERIRTYWYVIETMDFWPWKFPDAEADTEKLKKVLSKNQALRQELNGLAGTELVKRMKNHVQQLLGDQTRMRRRFDGWRSLQDGISMRHRAIEFRRAGAINYDLFKKRLGPEKAVDVKLATDLLVLRDIYDIAVIVSGDQDYVPAVKVVKDSGKVIVQAPLVSPPALGGLWSAVAKLLLLLAWPARIG